MAKVQQYEYELKLSDQATAIWKNFEANVAIGQRRIEQTLSRFGPIVAGAFSGVALKRFVDASNEAENASARLSQSLIQQGVRSKSVQNDMEAYSAALQKVTTFSDEQVTEVQALLVSMTGLTGKAVQPLVKATLDLSIGLGIDAQQAAKLVARSEEGAEALKRMGIEIGKTRDEQDRLAKITAEVEKRFGGMAEALGGTTQGRMTQFSNKLNDLEERFGLVIKRVGVELLPILEKFITGIQALPLPIQASIVAIGGLAAAIAVVNASLLANPITLALLGIAGAAIAMSTAFRTTGDQAEALSKEMADLKTEQDKLTTVDALTKEYEKLSVKTNLTTAEKKKLKVAMEDLATLVPEAVTGWDEEGKAIGINTGKLEENLKQRRDFLLIKEKEFIKSDIVDPLAEATKSYEDHVQGIQDARAETARMSKEAQSAGLFWDVYGKSISKTEFEEKQYTTIVERNRKALDENRTQIETLIGALAHYVKNVKDFNQVSEFLARAGMKPEMIEDLRKHWASLSGAVETAADTTANAKPKIDPLAGTLEELRKKAESLEDEFKKTQGIDAQIAAFNRWQGAANAFKAKQEEIERSSKGQTVRSAFQIKQMVDIQINEEQIRQEAEEIAKKFREGRRPQVDATYLANVMDQVKLEGDLREKEYKSEKERELGDLKQWYERAVELSHDNEAYLTRAKEVYERERLEIARKYQNEQWSEYVRAAEDALGESFKVLLGFTARRQQVDIAAVNRRNELAEIEDKKARQQLEKQLKDGEISRREYELRIQDLNATSLQRQTELHQAYAENSRNILSDIGDVWAKFWDKIVDDAIAALARVAASGLFKLLGGLLGGPIGGLLAGLFHEGGTVPKGAPRAHEGLYIDAPPAREFPILVRGGETIRTENQEASVQRAVRERDSFASSITQPSTTTINLHFHGPIADDEAFKRIVQSGMRRLGIESSEAYFRNNRSNVAI